MSKALMCMPAAHLSKTVTIKIAQGTPAHPLRRCGCDPTVLKLMRASMSRCGQEAALCTAAELCGMNTTVVDPMLCSDEAPCR